MTGDKGRGRRVAAQYGAPEDAVYGYDEWAALGRNDDVQVVYVVAPNGMDLEQVRQAAAVGKHVLCEKPMANTSAEAEAMIEACVGRKPRTPGEERLQDHRIMQAIYRSAKENRPVALPPVEGVDAFRGPPLDAE